MSLLGMFLIYLAGTVFGIIWGYNAGKKLIEVLVQFEGYRIRINAPEDCPLHIFEKIANNARSRVIREFDEGVRKAREKLKGVDKE